MSQPHHFVFNELQRQICKEVPFDLIKSHLLSRGVVKEENLSLYTSNPKRAMRTLTSLLRNKGFDVFVDFIQCIVDAEVELEQRGSSETVDFSIVETIQLAVEHFDSSHGSNHADRIPHRRKKMSIDTKLQTSQQELDVQSSLEQSTTLPPPPEEPAAASKTEQQELEQSVHSKPPSQESSPAQLDTKKIDEDVPIPASVTSSSLEPPSPSGDGQADCMPGYSPMPTREIEVPYILPCKGINIIPTML